MEDEEKILSDGWTTYHTHRGKVRKKIAGWQDASPLVLANCFLTNLIFNVDWWADLSSHQPNFQQERKYIRKVIPRWSSTKISAHRCGYQFVHQPKDFKHLMKCLKLFHCTKQKDLNYPSETTGNGSEDTEGCGASANRAQRHQLTSHVHKKGSGSFRVLDGRVGVNERGQNWRGLGPKCSRELCVIGSC